MGFLLPVEVRSVHQLLKANALSLCWMAHIVWLTWFRGGSPQNQSDEQKTESAGGDISQNSLSLLCVCTKDQILLLTNLFTAHLTLKHHCPLILSAEGLKKNTLTFNSFLTSWVQIVQHKIELHSKDGGQSLDCLWKHTCCSALKHRWKDGQ